MKKKCSKCQENKDSEAFTKRSSSKDGLHPWCRSCVQDYNKNHHKRNKKSANVRNKKWRENNVEYNKERNRKWMVENAEYRQEYKKRHRKENREKINSYKRQRRLELSQDPLFRLETNLRKRLYRAIKKIEGNALENKSISLESSNLLGCSIQDLQKHLEKQFTKEMSWNNYGQWHVDHIRPVSSFDLTDKSQVQECFHYANLQPLWAKDNYKKGSSY